MMRDLETSARVVYRISHLWVATCLKIGVLVGLMAVGTPPARCQGVKSMTIEGQVYTGDGSPLPSDITVRLEEAEGVMVAQQFVGTTGKFVFSDLGNKLFKLVVTAKGFQTATQDVDMHFLASRYPKIYLVPPDQKLVNSPTNSTSVSASDLAASKKARKEYEKGHLALQAGKYEEARDHLENAVAEDPCFARAHASLGVTFSMQNQFALAETALKKAIACDAGFLEAYIQLGILLNIENKFLENEAGLQTGIVHFPTEWQLYYQLGVAERGQGKLDKAEEAYLKAQSINSAVPAEFHVKLADVYLRRKRYEKAYAEMQAYLQADPMGRFADETKALMKRVESSGMLAHAQDKAETAPR